jgi:iron complex outermembrane recepter protein
MKVRLGLNRGAGRPAPASLKSGIRMVLVRNYLGLVIALLMAISAWSQESPKDLGEKSIEDLMNMEVTSVSKKEQKLSRTAAAIFVITQEDIRRSGATNIPDLLRMVPGMDVAQINGSTWAIGSRGFNAQFADKLQVMVDGRSLYSLTFSGVFWDTVDLPLSDIERIEVIRGPGGSIWGANAVTGVISIFTKKASATPGTSIEADGGTFQQGFGMAQYGGELGRATDFRIYAKYFNQRHMLDLNGQSGADGWHRLREGFRTDSRLSAHDSLMVEGDVSTGRERELGFELPSVTSPGFVAVSRGINLADGSLETIWDHTYSGGSDSRLRFSSDRHRRADPVSPETRDTFDLDFRHHLAAGKRQEIVWGLEYLHTDDEIGGSFTSAVFPAHRANQLFSMFIQDEIALVPQRLYVTLGSKLEHNDYTGFGVMPTVRGIWTPSDHQMFWAAVSKALRTPSRDETGLVLNTGSFPGPGGTPVLLRLLGNPNFKNESMISYEAGYRTMVSNRFSIDLAAYFNDWDNARTIEPSSFFSEPSPPPPHFVQTLLVENLLYGEAHGVEMQANWKVTDRWSLSPGYTFAQEHMHTRPNSRDTQTGPFEEGSSPDHIAQLRSHVELMRRLTWDASGYFNDHLPNQGPAGNVKIPAYVRLDTGLTWRLWERFSISLVGQNLLKDHHLEFEDVSGSVQSGQIKRSAYAKFTWQF